MYLFHILFLGPSNSPLYAWLQAQEEKVTQTEEAISVNFVKKHKINFIVSYGYRHIINKDVLELLPKKAVNLHISYLPWNRGADPNFWSFVDNTPKGVSIHYIDEGLDTGEIICQQKVNFSEDATFASSYQLLQQKIQNLFMAHWPQIKRNQYPGKPNTGGSFHASRDKETLLHLLPDGWHTPITEFKKLARKLNK